mgnify:CR=1 FL=1
MALACFYHGVNILGAVGDEIQKYRSVLQRKSLFKRAAHIFRAKPDGSGLVPGMERGTLGDVWAYLNGKWEPDDA